MPPSDSTTGKPTAESLAWDDLHYQSQLHCFNSKVGDVQVRFIVRGLNQKDVDPVAKALMPAVRKQFYKMNH